MRFYSLPLTRIHLTGVAVMPLTRLCNMPLLEVAENSLAIHAHNVGRHASKKCFLHGRKSFGREVPLDEQIPSQEIKSLMGSFEEPQLKRFSARSTTT